MEKLKSWKFKNESILSRDTASAKCSDIFHIVCDELGEYYNKRGFKYPRSRPNLTIKSNDIWLKIAFWSSRSNTAGEYVNLEIIPIFKSISLAKHLSGTKRQDGLTNRITLAGLKWCSKKL